MKKILYLCFALTAGLHGYSQTNSSTPCTSNAVIPCKAYIPQVVMDSTHKVKTFFQQANLSFLRGGGENDPVNKDNPLRNQASFSSINAQVLLEENRKKNK